MKAEEIQERLDSSSFDPKIQWWLGEIALQLAEANELARLRLRMELLVFGLGVNWSETTERQELRKKLEAL